MYKQFFLGQDGSKLLKGLPDPFSRHFDWTVTPMNNLLFTHKSVPVPKTVYVKTDFLPGFVSRVLPTIQNEFILITGASDYSPEINFSQEYKKLIKDSRVKYWYMNNMRNKNKKSFSLPAGIAAGKFWDRAGPKEVDETIMGLRESLLGTKRITDRVFAGFRDRDWNVCGDDMIIRPAIKKIVDNNLDLFDTISEDSLEFEDFVKKIADYKYILCPHGNGMDPNPTMWLALAVGTIPVIYNTPNAKDMFEGTNYVIFFDEFENIANKDLYQDRDPIDLEFLSGEYWANKIKEKI